MNVVEGKNYKFSFLILLLGLSAWIAWFTTLSFLQNGGYSAPNLGLAVLIPHTISLVVLLCFLANKRLRQIAFGTLEAKNESTSLYIWAVGSVVTLYVGMAIFKRMNSVPSENFMMVIANSPFIPVWIWMLIATLIVAPIAEELLYRGILLGVFKVNDSLGWRVVSVLLPAAIFMSVHLQYNNLSSYFVLFVLALLLGIARLASGGIKIPIIMHIAASALAWFFDVILVLHW